ncbi:DUF3592 domain-containing protein [Streptomyces sp. DSM 41527]|uniref:DUF3592 domain-containing protein n=1 Tax=Streptomyces mooreae TaxID=3075523 RepID=A0ABU2TF71_9ACTN|nr:DUF3592 domain-containing protein [Streptomyces sp. DSM 41527]MDT0459572.1 DUF3592 domain-containing protein [Streptomyces sp. DSM 41527]
MEPEWLLTLIALMLMGTAFLSVGVYLLRRVSKLSRTGVTANARIVRHVVRRHKDSDGIKSKAYYPVAAWTAQDGRTCEYESMFGRGVVKHGFGLGAHVTVRYDPEAPDRFTIEGWETKAPYLVFTTVGAVLTVGTVTALIMRLLAF